MRFLIALLIPISNMVQPFHVPATPLLTKKSYELMGSTNNGVKNASYKHISSNLAVSTMEPVPIYESNSQNDSHRNPKRRRASFAQRMRSIVNKDNQSSRIRREPKERKQSRENSSSSRPPNIEVVHTLEDYKNIVANEKERIVVVRFFATWCKSCKAMAPLFYRMVNEYPDILFVEVPVTGKNSELHQGLGVPSLPFGHIYHPIAGLVEETKISRKLFQKFGQILQWYVDGSCNVLDGGEFISHFDGTDDKHL